MVSIRIARVSAASAMAVAAVAGLVAPASAAQASTIRIGYAAAPAAAAKPNSNITGSGKAVKYSPTSLKSKWSGPKEQTCTAAKASFTVTNTTKAAETMTYMGSSFANIPAGKVLDVCAWGKGTATGVFGLKANKKAKLTVHVS